MKASNACVTGLGCICAAGGSVVEVMSSLYAGTRRPLPPTRVSSGLEKASPVFEVASDLGHVKRRDEASRTTLLALAAADEALGNAMLDRSILAGKRVGVVMGTTVGCTLNDEPFYRAYRNGEHPGMRTIDLFLGNNPAMYLSMFYECSGPFATIANACSSGTDAVGLAKTWVEDGTCDIVIAGGADELCRTTYIGFSSLMITSEGPCRPFDRGRSGLNLGEGAGVVIVESERSARERNAEVMAYVAGYGTSGDAYHPTAPHPDGLGLRRAIDMALKEAGTVAGEMAFINAHGTSTPENDKVEGRVIAGLFGASVPVVSTKSYTGHTLGAAGGIEAVLTVKGLIDGKIPATAGYEEYDEDCGIIPTRENTGMAGEFAMSDSLAFGGNNSVLVFRRGA